jgi:MFS transporter, FHS family, L-fucose permease
MQSLPFIIPFLGYFTVLLFASELTRKGKSQVLML